MKKPFLLLLLIIMLATACGQAPISSKASPTQSAPIAEATTIPSNTPLSTATYTTAPTLAATLTPSVVPTLTLAPTATRTVTSTPIPTYVDLRGQVIVERASCRYGPGEPYLFKYGLFDGNTLEIIGRNIVGTWIEIRAMGGTNPCWIKASLMAIKGNVMDVTPIQPEAVRLPSSPYYSALSAVMAKRAGSTVTIFWTPLTLRAGDDSGQYRYLVEAWVCQAGKLVFTPLGTYDTEVKITDEPGCSEPSHVRVYGVEKHGYTRWREPAWPRG